MAVNYVLLERVELATSVSSVTFNNIPQTGYTDLKIVASCRSNRSDTNNDWAQLTFNNNTSNYNLTMVYGGGTGTPSSYTQSSGAIPRYAGEINGNTATTNVYGNLELYIPNYTLNNYKTYSCDAVSENNAVAATRSITAGLWSDTSAISSIKLNPYIGTLFLQYSTFSLYGLAAVGTTPTLPAKAQGGDTVITDGTYWYHVFLNSGTFTPQTALTCDYLVVAGGGGADQTGGGGGAGGLRSTVGNTGGGGSLESSVSITTATTVIVGAGGVSYSVFPSNGSNSSFGSITSTGGGRGVNNGNLTVGSGGSGGGSGGGNFGSGGSGTTNQGYAGGSGGAGYPNDNGGGGGGAGAVGANGSSGNGGAGGNGVLVSALATPTYTGVSGYYAGGGGGWQRNAGTGPSGGSGGGGRGSSATVVNTAPTQNTGSGAGASGGNTEYGGASGIVIIRYAV
jgi:hypothetical protein